MSKRMRRTFTAYENARSLRLGVRKRIRAVELKLGAPASVGTGTGQSEIGGAGTRASKTLRFCLFRVGTARA
jgi:hypothetical protein